MIFLFLFFICFTQLVSLQNPLPPRLQQMAIREKPIIPNRLLNPSLDESIVHVLLDPFAPNKAKEKLSGKPSDLVLSCATRESLQDLPEFFPRFLCGLISLYQEHNVTSLPFTRTLFPRPSSAIRFMNDVANYPCHKLNMSDVVALAPNRIYSACMNDSDSTGFSQFDTAYVMDHPFPDVPKCAKNETIRPCELRSMLVQHKVIYQQRDCCCQSADCAVLAFSQTKSLTPVILTSIDLQNSSYIEIVPTTIDTTTAITAPTLVTSTLSNTTQSNP